MVFRRVFEGDDENAKLSVEVGAEAKVPLNAFSLKVQPIFVKDRIRAFALSSWMGITFLVFSYAVEGGVMIFGKDALWKMPI